MKNVNAFVNKSFGINLFGIVAMMLIGQASYSQVNDPAKEVNMNLNEFQKMAEFPGGLKEFYAKIITDFDNYDIDYEGFSKINVSFSIEKDGSLSSIKVNNKEMSASMKKSIVKVLKSIKTRWSPAIINDQPVRSVYDLPIVFNEK